MRIRQSDIAKIANVSQATVSRVLSGDERVEDDIRQRVLVAIETHNYKPDVRARSLRTLQTHLIGLVVKRPHGALQGDPFYAQLISEILESLASTPYHLCVDMATTDSGQVAVYDELLRTRRVDGVLLVESEACFWSNRRPTTSVSSGCSTMTSRSWCSARPTRRGSIRSTTTTFLPARLLPSTWSSEATRIS